MKVPVVAPAGTVKLGGTVAAAFPEVKVTTAPPAGAGAARVTVPVDVVPPVTDVGLTVNPVRNGVPIAVKTSAVFPWPDPI